MAGAIDVFRPGWQHVRGLTRDFVLAVPDERWEYSPHPRFAPFHKQVRHLVCVQGVYIDGIRQRVTDFGRKHDHYAGPLDRDSLLAALAEKDRALDEVLSSIDPADEDDWLIEFYGRQPLAAYLNVIRHHEAIHHGEWSFYAALGGFETPASWKLQWGI